MKILFTLFIVCATGCVSTYVKTDRWECKRISFGYNARMPALKMTPSGTIELSNYSGEVDPELVKAIETALQAIIRAGVAVP